MFLFPYRDDNDRESVPVFTVAIIITNTLLFVVPALSGYLHDLFPVYGYTFAAVFTRPYIIITSLFLHANLLHLISNLWFLWLFGDNIEDKFGHFRFLGLYLTSGLIGNLLHTVFTLFISDIPVIGASGAVAGIMGAYLVRFPRAKLRCFFLLIIIPMFIKIRVFWFLGFWMVFEFLSAITIFSGNIAHWAHVGGFAYGFIWTMRRRKKVSKLTS